MIPLQDVDLQTIEEAALEKWRKRISPKTVNKVLTTLTAVLALAKRHKIRKDNPASEAERLRVEDGEEGLMEVSPEHVLNKQEVRHLIEATESGSIERLLIMVLCLTGVRVGEALGL